MKKWLITFFVLTMSHLSAVQADEVFASLEDLQQGYKAKWSTLVSSLEQRDDLTFVEKLAIYDQEITALKQDYAQAKIGEYRDNEVTITVEHECKGRPAGSTKNCGYRCVERPNEDMYTTEEWVTFNGDAMGTIVNEEKACLKLEAKGNVKKVGSVTAVFKYRNSFVDYKVADDASELFSSFLKGSH